MFHILNLPNYTTRHHIKNKFENDPTNMTDELTRSGGGFWSFLTSDWKKEMPRREIDESEWATPGIRFWWVGHATCLFQFGDIFILTDPVFSNSAAPVSLVIRRTTETPIAIDKLPPISYVLLSHDHYDHLNYKSMKRLAELNPEMQVLCGIGTADLIQSWGLKAVAFDWRQEATVGDLTFTCMPARHWSNRRMYDAGKRLWVSFIIRYQGVVVYVPGDTAVGEHFAEVRQYVGKPVDLVPMAIGPKHPEKLMRVHHVDGIQAVQMTMVLEAVRTVPIHWGLFPLGAHSEKTDLDDFEETAAHYQYDGARVLRLGGMLEWNGKSFEVPDSKALLHD